MPPNNSNKQTLENTDVTSGKRLGQLSLRVRGCVFRRGCWFLLLGLWASIVATSLNFSWLEIRRHNLEVATAGARNMFRMVVLTRLWNAKHQGVYVPTDEEIRPNPYLHHPRRDLKTTDGINLTMINPAFMTRLIAEVAAQERGVQFHITSLRPIRPDNKADPWETQALNRFEEGVQEVTELLPSESGMQYRYMAPLPVVQACLKCHADQGYKLNDIRGGISVTQPYTPFETAARQIFRLEIIKHLTVFLLVAAAGWWLLSQLRWRWMALENNIRELHRTRDKLVQSENLASLGRMVAGFAHELNTPVGVAVGAISHAEQSLNAMDSLIRQDEVSEEAIQAQVDTLRESSSLALSNLRRAANLVSSFKRSSIDQVSENPRLFAVREIIDDVLLSLHNQLKRMPVDIEVDCPAELMVDGQPGYYDQLITNLVQNSLIHGFADGTRQGRIRIRVRVESDGRLGIHFSDDGAGMQEAVNAKAFEPFFTTRRGQGSSGLGLYICHQLATGRLQGEISCTSALGKGTRFDILIPAQLRNTAGHVSEYKP